MSPDARLNKLMPSLTARERAILILDSWKDDSHEDPNWCRTMPQSQVQEFNRYIDLMKVANRELARVIRMLEQMAETLELRFCWLFDQVLWQEHVDEIRRAIRLTVREPITEAEHAAKVEAARSEWLPVEELAGMLAGDHEAWADEDFAKGDDGEREITDEAWNRVGAEKESWLQTLVAEGTLPGRGKGRRLKIKMGAFDNLMGRKTGACPEDDGYLSYRVLPDSRAEEVELDRLGLRRLQGVLDWRAFDDTTDSDPPDSLHRLRESLKEGIAHQLISAWVQLKTLEVVLDDIEAEFGGSDPLRPSPRARLEETRTKLLTTQEHLRVLDMEVVLRDPLPEEIEEMREFVRK